MSIVHKAECSNFFQVVDRNKFITAFCVFVWLLKSKEKINIDREKATEDARGGTSTPVRGTQINGCKPKDRIGSRENSTWTTVDEHALCLGLVHTTLKFAVSPSSPRFLNERAYLSSSNGVAAGAQEDPVFRHAVCFSFSSGMCNLRAIRLPRLLVSLSVALVFTNISVAGGSKERVLGEVSALRAGGSHRWELQCTHLLREEVHPGSLNEDDLCMYLP